MKKKNTNIIEDYMRAKQKKETNGFEDAFVKNIAYQPYEKLIKDLLIRV